MYDNDNDNDNVELSLEPSDFESIESEAYLTSDDLTDLLGTDYRLK